MDKTKNINNFKNKVIRLETPYEEIKFIPKEKIDYFKEKYDINLYRFVDKEYRRYMSDKIIKVVETKLFQKPSCDYKIKKTKKSGDSYYYHLVDEDEYDLKDEIEMLNSTGGLFAFIDKENPDFSEIATDIMDYIGFYDVFDYDIENNKIIDIVDRGLFKEIKNLLSSKSSKNVEVEKELEEMDVDNNKDDGENINNSFSGIGD